MTDCPPLCLAHGYHLTAHGGRPAMTHDSDHLTTIADQLAELPTLAVGQSDDLKLSLGRYRVWLARTTKADGEAFDRRVTIEHKAPDGRWADWESFDGDHPGVLSLVTERRTDGDDVQMFITEAIGEPVA